MAKTLIIEGLLVVGKQTDLSLVLAATAAAVVVVIILFLLILQQLLCRMLVLVTLAMTEEMRATALSRRGPRCQPPKCCLCSSSILVYYTISHYIILYYIILHYIILYYIIL